ncbi:MAG: FAD-dependent oxidoreductase [Desulfatibacillaceae bacterium]|nr:FAD-dependent oxidoreductase [Desulfatibacillaceae bacterium]
MTVRKLDAAIIGAGTAGLYAAAQVARRTDNFALFEGGIQGTTCARVGCMPSKALIAQVRAFACAADQTQGAWPAKIGEILAAVRTVRDRLFQKTAANGQKKFGEKLIPAAVSFTGPMKIVADGIEYQCRSIVIATGSTPVIPPGWELAEGKIVTTNQFFELKTFGPKVLVVGMGPLGIEISQALARTGFGVTTVEMGSKIAGLSDPKVTEALGEILDNQPNLEWHTNFSARLLEAGGQVKVALKNMESGLEREQSFDLVLLATGRRPNVDGLNLEASGLELNKKGLPVFDPATLACKGQSVFMAGDVEGGRQLYHLAARHGILAGANAVNADKPGEPPVMPNLGIVFTDPCVAMVGADYSELDQDSIIIGEADAAFSGRGAVDGGRQGLLRLYFDKNSQLFLGAQMAVPAGEHLAHMLIPMLSSSYTLEQMADTVYYHPTYEELIQTAALNAKARQKKD